MITLQSYRRLRGLSMVAVLVAVLGAAGGPLLGQSFQGMGFAPGLEQRSSAHAVSADGSVVVGVVGRIGREPESQAFRWAVDGGYELLEDFAGGMLGGSAWGVTRDGMIVVGRGASVPANSDPYVVAFDRSDAAVWGRGISRLTEFVAEAGFPPSQIDDPVFFTSVASGASDDARVIVGSGSYLIDNAGRGVDRSEAFVWTDGVPELAFGAGDWQYSSAHAVSADGTVVVGSASVDNQSGTGNDTIWAMLRRGDGTVEVLSDRPGFGQSNSADAVSADGRFVVGDSDERAFRWSEDGGVQDLGLAGRFDQSDATGVSGDGSVVVGTLGVSGVFDIDAFVWIEHEGMRLLRDVVAPGSPAIAGWTALRATAVSNDGRVVVGYGRNPEGLFEAFRAELWSVCDAELNGDGVLDLGDIQAFLGLYLTGDLAVDLNVDGVVDLGDLQAFVAAFLAGC